MFDKNFFKQINQDKPVLVAGDPEKISMKKNDDNNGITYHINQIKYAVSKKRLKLFFL